MNEKTTEQHLYHGDSKSVLKTIKDGSIDLLCTDPPYGISFKNKKWDKLLPDTEIWTECFRVLKEGAFIAVMSATRSDVKWRMCRDLEEAGFDLSFSDLEWVYHTGFPKASDTSKMLDKRGGYTEISKKYEGSKLGFNVKPARETIIIAMKPFKEKTYIDHVLNFEALPENIKMTYPLIQTLKPSKKEKDLGIKDLEKNGHVTVKPVKLMSYIITLFTREGDWVLDPFNGSGTTGVASKLLNRNYIGIELEEDSYNIANERVSIDRQELIKFFKDLITKEEQTKLDL